MELREVVRRNLRGLRLERALSQEALSLQSGFYRTCVGLIERGKHVPTVDTLAKLARTLQIDPRDLLDPELTTTPSSAPAGPRKARRPPS